ncbi:3324_t:CDS:2 [Ambispora gerdemannii]|uniref:3324_t:CDS:1 n=1 Tax=Ambispora gerdemannii TaxID=144530 RepID=A0A9N9BNC0_9GLOM|nr:3324_t:CDS:2 [Ambispora gerdemannii]
MFAYKSNLFLRPTIGDEYPATLNEGDLQGEIPSEDQADSEEQVYSDVAEESEDSDAAAKKKKKSAATSSSSKKAPSKKKETSKARKTAPESKSKKPATKKESSSEEDTDDDNEDTKRPKKKKRKNDSDEYSESDNDLREELQGLDTSLIIKGGRRTRGNKIDYKQFGPDPESEDE